MINQLEAKHTITYYVKFETHDRVTEWKDFTSDVFEEKVDLSEHVKKFMQRLCSDDRVYWGLEMIDMRQYRKAVLCKVKIDDQLIDLEKGIEE